MRDGDITRMMRVAIVGSGISGLAAAHALDALPRPHEIVMFEAAARPGGHVYTVLADGHAIDMGFIVHSRERYPRFSLMLHQLAITTRPTTMSFSVSHGELEWGSESLGALFAQRRRLTDPRHWRLLAQVMAFLWRAQRDIERFHRECRRDPDEHDLRAAQHEHELRRVSQQEHDLSQHDHELRVSQHELARLSLDEYLSRRRVSRDVRDRFVIPLAAALWSLAPAHCGEFPALTYLRFLDHHGMLSPIRPLR